MLLDFDDDGPGPVVVLLHGFPMDRTMWSFQRSSVGSIYRLITPDLRGHGRSAAPDGVYMVDAMADDVIETLDALQLTEPIHLGGLSMGGYIALSIAQRYPERLKALMLINTRAAADAPEAAAKREEQAREIEASGTTEPIIAAMLPKLFAESTVQTHPELVKRLHTHMSHTPPRAVVGTLRGLAARPDRTALLPRITIPTLVIAGLEDAVVPIAEARAMAAAIPQSHFVAVPHAGHLAPLENHQATDAAILGFLESLW